jgi:hypothetical protein
VRYQVIRMLKKDGKNGPLYGPKTHVHPDAIDEIDLDENDPMTEELLEAGAIQEFVVTSTQASKLKRRIDELEAEVASLRGEKPRRRLPEPARNPVKKVLRMSDVQRARRSA